MPPTRTEHEHHLARRNAERVMSFGDHLEELRVRVILALLGLIIALIAGLALGAPMLNLLLRPLTDALQNAGQPVQLLATSPFETFVAYLKVGLIFAILVAFPWIVYQLWLFVAPGLYAAEKRFVYFLIPLSGVLSALSALFLYYFLLPVSLYFLIIFGTGIVKESPGIAEVPPGIVAPFIPVLKGDPPPALLAEDGPFPPGSSWINSNIAQLRFHVGAGKIMGLALNSGGQIAQMYRVGEYISIVFGLAFAFAVAFQLPLVMLLLNWVGIIEPKDVTKYRKHAVFGCAVGGAVFTPQDPWSMIMLGTALYALFEFGIVLMRFVPARSVATRFGTASANEPTRPTHEKEPPDAGDE